MVIDSFVPAAPKPGDQVRISGTVTNTSSVTLGNPQALACIDQHRMDTRAELAAVSTDPEDCTGTKELVFQEFDSALAPNATLRFSLSVPWDKWDIGDRRGVYAVGAYLRADISDGVRDTVGRARTLMPVVPAGSTPRKVQTAMVLPLRHRPTRLAAERFANDSLAEAMAPNGRLGRQLQAGIKPKVTWLADPALLDQARLLADGYKLLSTDNQLTTGTKGQRAEDWLAKLTGARDQDPVVLLPYGDPDVASFVDNGLADLVQESRKETGDFAFTSGPAARSGLWLEAGSATGRTLVAGTTGFAGSDPTDLTLVSNWSWPVSERPNLLPSPVLDIATPEGPQKTTRAIVTDSALTAGGPDPATATTPVQMRQRFAAETALLAATPGTGPLTVVALPPRGFDPSGIATEALLQGLTLPWIQQIGLDQVSTAAARPARTPTMPRTPPGLNESHIQQIKQLNRLIDTYGSLVTDRDRAVAPLETLLLQAGSTSWRGWLQEAQRFLTFQIRTVNGQLSKVHIVSGQTDSNPQRPIEVTLSGRNGQFPLTIANELDQSVRVGVRVRSQNRSDLKIEPLLTKTLFARQKATFQVEASAQQNGVIQASVQVVTAGGAPVGREQQLVIQAAQYGDVGWILVGAAVALLFGTSLIRIYRRIRNERRNPSKPGGTEPGQATPAAADGAIATDEQPGTDARPESDVPVQSHVQQAEADVPKTVREGAGTTDG